MKHHLTSLCFIIFFSLTANSSAQELSSKETILQKMELANDYFMTKWPDPGADIVTDKTRPSNLWTRATYYEGLMTLYNTNLDQDLYDYAVEWGESHEWEPTYGRRTTRDGDHQCCGQTYIELYQISNNADWILPITETMDNMTDDDDNDDWSWIDAIQMSMPVFAKLGVVHNDTSYFDKMYKLYSYSKNQHGTNGLYNPVDHLWWRDRDFDPPTTTPNGLSVYWSRGNGWVYAALVRVLSVIPENETHRAEYVQDFLDMSEALIAIQREDGFWNTSLVDPNDYGGKETSGTGFFIYGLAWGINNGFLDSASYMPAVIKGWEGMENDALHNNGFLGWMQSTGKQPSDGQPLSYTRVPNFEDYGLGAFLLAGSETYKLAVEGTDFDDDGIFDDEDNCISNSNSAQEDIDADGMGDACDDDIDGDGFDNEEDNCSMIFNDDQLDTNEDGEGDVCDDNIDGDSILNDQDNCPIISNDDQLDTDEDGEGDVCDDDDDGDSVEDASDICPNTPANEVANDEGCSPSQTEGLSEYFNPGEKSGFLTVYPNPSGGIFHITYQIESQTHVNLRVINMKGQLIKILENKSWKNPGNYISEWNPASEESDLPKGIYYLQLDTDKINSVYKILIK